MEEPNNPFAPTQTVVEVPTAGNQDDKEKLYDNIDILCDWQQHTVEWIFSVLGADGRELFCYYACAVLQQKEPTSNVKDVALEVWERMPEGHRRAWAEATPQILLEGTRGFEDLLSTTEASDMAIELRAVAERACTEYFQRLDAEEKKKERKAKKREQRLQLKARGLEMKAESKNGPLRLLLAASTEHAEGGEDEDRLMNRFESVEGMAIFCYHTLSFVAEKLEIPKATREVEAIIQEMWDLAVEDRRFWENMADKFVATVKTKPAKYLAIRRGNYQLKCAYKLYCNQKLQEEQRVHAMEKRKEKVAFFASTPVLNALTGSQVGGCSDEELIPKILRGIQDRVTTFPAMVLYGRVHGARVCYSPLKMDVTGIGARLRVLRMEGGAALQYESLLQPFANWNLGAFPEISDSEKDLMDEFVSKAKIHSYRSQWLLHQQCYDRIMPISGTNPSEVVAAVVRSARNRCKQVNPESLLLRPLEEALETGQEGLKEAYKLSQTKLKEWSLHSVSEGLGAQVMRCFETEAGPEEYEDRIETVLYRFKMKCPAAVFGREGDHLQRLRTSEGYVDGPGRSRYDV